MNHIPHQMMIGAILLVGVFGCGSQSPSNAISTDGNEQAPSKSATGKSTSDRDSETMPEFTATELAQEFMDNSTGASEKYAQKTLIVSGTTHGAVYVNNGLDYCSFGLAGISVPEDVESQVRKYYVECRIDGAEKAEGIEKGQAVRVKGRFVNNIASQILLHDCEILD